MKLVVCDCILQRFWAQEFDSGFVGGSLRLILEMLSDRQFVACIYISRAESVNSQQVLGTQEVKLEALPLTRQAFLDLLDGRTPAISEPGFLSKELAQKITEEVRPLISPYQHVAGPPLEKVGVAQFEFQAQSEEDFKNRDAGCMSFPSIYSSLR